MAGRVRLTARGRGMLLVGAGILAAGLGAESLALMAAGLFAMVLVAAALGAGLLHRNRLVVVAAQAPSLLRSGQRFATSVEVSGDPGRGPVVLSGLLPWWARSEQGDAEVLMVVPGRSPQRVALTGAVHRRGVYDWPAVEVVVSDPFGISTGLITCRRNWRTVVGPAVEPLRPARVPAITAGTSQFDDAAVLSRRALREAGSSPIPRAYRPGDGQRRIHWPATARVGEPMVRADDGGPAARAVVELDCRAAGYRLESGFERAVAAAASICTDLLQRGWAVSLRRQDGMLLTQAAWAEGPGGEIDVLRALAQVELDGPGTGIIAGEQHPLEAVFAVRGGAGATPWASPPATCLACEQPATAGAQGTLVWDGSGPLAAVWSAATARLAVR